MAAEWPWQQEAQAWPVRLALCPSLWEEAKGRRLRTESRGPRGFKAPLRVVAGWAAVQEGATC